MSATDRHSISMMAVRFIGHEKPVSERVMNLRNLFKNLYLTADE